MRVTMQDSTELFIRPIFHWINTTLCISGYQIIGRHRKQRYMVSPGYVTATTLKPSYLRTAEESSL